MIKIPLYLTKDSRKLLKISFLGHIFNDMYWFVLPLILPLIKAEFNLNYTQSGLLFTSYIAMGAFGSLITGYLGDRIGRRFILSWGFFFGSLALVLCIFSSNYWQLFFTLILLGAGISTFHPSMIAVLSNSFTSKRGTIMGLFQFWGWVGTISAVIIISSLIRVAPNWRGILLILSIPGFIFAPLFFKSLKPLIAEKKSEDNKKNKNYQQLSLSEKKTIAPLPFIIFMIASSLFMMTHYAVINFMPTYLVEEKFFSLTVAGYSFALVGLGGFLGTITSGKMCDKLSAFTTLIIFIGFTGPVIIFLTFLQNYTSIIIFLIIFGVVYSGLFPAQQAYLAEITPQKSRGGYYGIVFCLGYIVGAIDPGITGVIADRIGLSNALKISTIPIFISLILLFALKIAKQQKTKTVN